LLCCVDYHSFVWPKFVVGQADADRVLLAPIFFLEHQWFDHECLAGDYDFEVEAAVGTADDFSLQGVFWDGN